MSLARNLLPLAVAGLVVVLLLPAEDVTHLFGPADPVLDPPPPNTLPSESPTAAMPSEVERDSNVPTYVVLDPASLPDDASGMPPASGDTETRTAAIEPIPSPYQPDETLGAAPLLPDHEQAIPEGEPFDLPPDETITGSIPEDLEEERIADEVERAAPRDGTPAFVGRSAVNMRVGPTTSTASITVLDPGEPVSILDMSGGWSLVERADGETGWVYSTYIGDRPPSREAAAPRREATTPRQQQPERTSNNRGTRVSSAALHARPSESSDRLFTLRPGEALRVVERRGSWARVVTRSGISGWVRVD